MLLYSSSTYNFATLIFEKTSCKTSFQGHYQKTRHSDMQAFSYLKSD